MSQHSSGVAAVGIASNDEGDTEMGSDAVPKAATVAPAAAVGGSTNTVDPPPHRALKGGTIASGASDSPSDVSVEAPAVPAVEAPAEPVEAPVVPGVEAPTVPGVEAPAVPAVEAPAEPVEAPVVPGVEAPTVPGVEAPTVPAAAETPVAPAAVTPASGSVPSHSAGGMALKADPGSELRG